MSADEELLAAWRAGDATAGEALFDRHFVALARFFRTKARDGLDDLLQTTMLALLESSDRFRGEGSFRSFVFGVAYNVLRNHHRARRTTQERVDFTTASVCDLAPGPLQWVAEKAEQRLLLEGLRNIPVESQVLLELYYWESLTAPDIAAAMQVPVGTVRTRIRKAKSQLQDAMRGISEDVAVLQSTLSELEDWARSVRGVPR